jgi:exosortase/archaeosortase family protein
MKSRKVYPKIIRLAVRYLILVLIAIPNLWIFYTIFTPLTTYPSYWLTKIFFDTSLLGNNILLIRGTIPIELIKSCIAGSAYYLLTILNLSVPNITLGKRINMLLFSFLTFLVINVLRIVALTAIYVSANPIFDVTHEIFWYSLSTIFVVGIWFAEVKIFKVRGIPVYSDIKFLLRHAKK